MTGYIEINFKIIVFIENKMKRLSNLYYNKYNILVTNIISMIKVIYLDNFQKKDEYVQKKWVTFTKLLDKSVILQAAMNIFYFLI